MKPEQQIRYLQLEVTKLKTEATQLRKALKENSRHARRIETAYEDALLLATWHAGGVTPSRRYAASHQMTQNRWQNAIALLKMVRIITRYRTWITDDLPVIESKLSIARNRALEDPQLFFLRLNRHGKR